jgi:hypothetical protein
LTEPMYEGADAPITRDDDTGQESNVRVSRRGSSTRRPQMSGGYGQPTGYGQPVGYGQQMGYGPMGGYGGWAMRPRRQYPIETKPFFLTSEFAVGIVAVIGLIITAATNHTMGVRLFWELTTAIVAAYLISRGIAKSGTRSNSWDPREHLDWGRGDGDE